MKVRELVGEELDYWVAKALGWVDYPDDSIERGSMWHCEPDKTPFGRVLSKRHFRPSTDWQDGGRLIESLRIDVVAYTNEKGDAVWFASNNGEDRCFADTPLVAAMRHIVYVKFGEDV